MSLTPRQDAQETYDIRRRAHREELAREAGRAYAAIERKDAEAEAVFSVCLREALPATLQHFPGISARLDEAALRRVATAWAGELLAAVR